MTIHTDDMYWLLNCDPSAASQARALIWEALARLGLEVSLIDDGTAIVGELVANAVVHGVPPVELQLRPSSREVRLLVVDRGPGEPKLSPLTMDSQSGRGLHVVAAYSGGSCGTAAATYRSNRNLEGRAVWAAVPRRPRCLDEFEPAAAARLLQRWLTRCGLRGVVSGAEGELALVSVAAGCTIWCRPAHLTWRTEDGEWVFAYRELPELVDRVRTWSSVARPKAEGAAIARSARVSLSTALASP